MRKHGHFRRHKKKYLAAAGAAALASPFAFQRFRGAVDMFGRGIFPKGGGVPFGKRWEAARGGAKKAWEALKGGGAFKRSTAAKGKFNKLELALGYSKAPQKPFDPEVWRHSLDQTIKAKQASSQASTKKAVKDVAKRIKQAKAKEAAKAEKAIAKRTKQNLAKKEAARAAEKKERDERRALARTIKKEMKNRDRQQMATIAKNRALKEAGSRTDKHSRNTWATDEKRAALAASREAREKWKTTARAKRLDRRFTRRANDMRARTRAKKVASQATKGNLLY